MATQATAPVEGLTVSAYKIPTDAPESDGTLQWEATTLVVVEASAGGVTGLAYTYGDPAVAALIRDQFAELTTGRDAMAIGAHWKAMIGAIRNQGRPGISSMAIAAVDNALWDLKARLLDLPLVTLLGAQREGVPVYGSGGFTSYSIERLQTQLGEWAAGGMSSVKMKVGRNPEQDVDRVRAAREAIGPDAGLLVDANGAYSRKQALAKAEAFAAFDVSWFEEPVSSDDLEGLRLLRDRAPPGMEITTGEYGYHLPYFRDLLKAGAVDVLQADATRCSGISTFLGVGSLCRAFNLPLSSHTAPSLHVHPGCALSEIRHLEYFHDHARIEQMLFDGSPSPRDGMLFPDLTRPGLGLALNRDEAKRYAL